MVKFITLIFIIVLGIFTYLSIFNMDSVTILLYRDIPYELPKIALIILSSAVGAFMMLFIYFVKDTRRFIKTKQIQKIKKKEEKVNTHYSRAIHYVLWKRIDDAVVQFNDALKENPEHIPSLLQMGDIYLKQKDFKTTNEYYQKAKALDPENIETLFKLVQLKETTKQLSDAVDHVDEILHIEPDNLTALYKKRELFEKLSKWDELIDLQKDILKLKIDEEEKEEEKDFLIGYNYEYGKKSLENNEIEQATNTFKTILKMDKLFIPAHLGMAEVMLNEDNTEEAINYLEKMYEETKSIPLLVKLEDLIINVGEPGRLIRIYRNAISAEPNNNTLKLFQGKLYYRLEMLDDTLDAFNSIEPGIFFPELHKLRGGIYLKRKQYERAVGEFLKVVDMKKALWIPYRCSYCGYLSDQWSGRCPSCKKWNTFYFDLHETCKIKESLEFVEKSSE